MNFLAWREVDPTATRAWKRATMRRRCPLPTKECSRDEVVRPFLGSDLEQFLVVIDSRSSHGWLSATFHQCSFLGFEETPRALWRDGDTRVIQACLLEIQRILLSKSVGSRASVL